MNKRWRRRETELQNIEIQLEATKLLKAEHTETFKKLSAVLHRQELSLTATYLETSQAHFWPTLEKVQLGKDSAQFGAL